MLQNLSATPARRNLEFGIYRDGDNNLDAIQEATLSQALRTSERDPRVEFTVEDTTRLHALKDGIVEGRLHTERYTIAGGAIDGVHEGPAAMMSDESHLAGFVARTLDNAESVGAKQTWVDLVDHGGGDGGGLQTADGRVMTMPDIAKAISDGIAMHARAHPEDAGRGVDGVVANQCLMDTMGFAEGYYRYRENVRVLILVRVLVLARVPVLVRVINPRPRAGVLDRLSGPEGRRSRDARSPMDPAI